MQWEFTCINYARLPNLPQNHKTWTATKHKKTPSWQCRLTDGIMNFLCMLVRSVATVFYWATSVSGPVFIYSSLMMTGLSHLSTCVMIQSVLERNQIFLKKVISFSFHFLVCQEKYCDCKVRLAMIWCDFLTRPMSMAFCCMWLINNDATFCVLKLVVEIPEMKLFVDQIE